MLDNAGQDNPKPPRLDNLKLFFSRFNLKKILGFSFVLVLAVATFASVYLTSNLNQKQDIRSKAAEIQRVVNPLKNGKISATPNPCVTSGQYCTSTVSWSTFGVRNVCIIRLPNPYPSDNWVFDVGNRSGSKSTNFQTVWWPDTLVLYANCPSSYSYGAQVKLDPGLRELARVTLTTAQQKPTPNQYPAQKKVDTSNLIVYQTWLNYYAQNPAVGQNDIKVFSNAASHLKELADMGVTMIQLSAFHPLYNGATSGTTIGSPANILDHYDVNPGYAGFPDPKTNSGTKDVRIQALKDYVSQAHDLGMKVIADCIYHSTSPYNSLVKTNPDYYRHDGQGNLIYLGRYNQVELNFLNPDVVKYLIDMTKYWVQTVGIDGCRSDVATAENIQLLYTNKKQSFWAELNNELKKIKPSWFQVAELTGELNKWGGPFSGPGYNPGETYTNVYSFDALYGVKHMTALRRLLNQNNTASALQNVWMYPDMDTNHLRDTPLPGTIFYRTEDNGDQYPRAEVLSGGNSAMLAGMAVNFTLDGIPFIFNGQEIGDTAATSVQVQKYISWTTPPQPQNRAVFKQLIGIRKSHSALTKGTTTWYIMDKPDQVISYLRQDRDDKVLVIVNLSPDSLDNVKVTGDNQLNGILTPIYNSNDQNKKVSQPKNNQITLSLEPWGYLIASLK